MRFTKRLRGTLCAGLLLPLLLSETGAAQTKQAELIDRLESGLNEQLTPDECKQVVSALDAAETVPGSDLWIKTRFLSAVASLRVEQYQACRAEIDRLKPKVDRKRLPELWFRCHSVDAALLFLTGDKEASLRAHQTLLEAPDEAVTPVYRIRAQANYAATLRDLGRLDEAVGVYEELVVEAITHEIDVAAIHAGNNLIGILLDLGDFQSADRVLHALKPVRERAPRTTGCLFLDLKECELLRAAGRLDQAEAGLRDFLRDDSLVPQAAGVAHQLLADVLSDKGDLEGATEAAHQSISSSLGANLTLAKLTMARILVKNSEYQAAIDTLQSVDASNEPPGRRKLVHLLRLQAELGLNGTPEAMHDLQQLVAAEGSIHQQAMRVRDDYLASQLEAARQSRLLEQSRAKADADRRVTRAIVPLILLVAIVVCTACHLFWRRRAETLLVQQQVLRNEELQQLVDAKVEELKTTLEAQAELAQALERKKRIEAVGMLAAGVAHDMNNLLQVISNANEILAADSVSVAQRSAIRLSTDSVQHGAAIVGGLLAYSRQQPLATEDLRLTDYLEATLPLFKSAVGDAINIEIHDESEKAGVHVDSARLTTSLINILSNSRDAMTGCGTIEIDVRRLTVCVGDTRWNQVASGSYLSIAVSDTGCGMSETQIARATEPFFSTKYDVGDGTGLGLSSAFGFFRQSGGDIKIESTLGVGTTLTIVLPAIELKPQPTTDEVEHSPVGNRRLLLVEDDASVAQSLRQLLSHLAMDEEWVQCSDEARRKLLDEPDFDFVLTDITLPGSMDGVELAQWISARHPRLPVLLMSGYHSNGADADLSILRKPFGVSELCDFLNEHLPQSDPGGGGVSVA